MMKPKFKMTGSARPIPVWLWFFSIFAVSSFVGLLMYLDLYEKGKANGNKAVPAVSSLFSGKESGFVGKIKQQKPATPKKESNHENNDTSFDFYSLLPKMEVLVPDSENSHPAKKSNDKGKEKQSRSLTAHHHTSSPLPNNKGRYFLQAGAFKDLQAADRMKANLGLLGIESKIESVTLQTGVWHRVRIGPFADLQRLNKTRDIMKSNSIRSITVKVNS